MAVQYHRSFNFLVAVTAMDTAPIINKLISDDHAVWMKKRESRTFFVQAEYVKLSAELSVVAFCCFFQHMQVSIKIGFLFEGGSIDTLQHLVFRITAPISACNILQFYRFYFAC